LIQDACCDFESVESVNNRLYDRLHQLVATPFFRFHKVSEGRSTGEEEDRPTCQLDVTDLAPSLQVDLFKECPFWQEQGSCMNRACGVETTDEVSTRCGELLLTTTDSRHQEHIPEAWRSYRLGELKRTEGEVVSQDSNETTWRDRTDDIVAAVRHLAQL
jgi:hypothetical protein